jgi:SOS-response transcriptional repressor LexA
MPRTRRVLAFVTSYIQEHGYPPALREIGEACDISSTSVVAYHLRLLARDGAIDLTGDGASRALRLRGARFVLPGDAVVVDVGGMVTHGAFVS